MAPRSWAQGTRLEFLSSRGPDYVLACNTQTKHSWLDNLYYEWFAEYHVSLPDDVEPISGALYEEPSTPEGIKEHKQDLKKKRLSLKRWFNHHWHPKKANNKRNQDSVTSTANLFPIIRPESLSLPNSLPSTSVPKPRRKQLIHVYSSLFYEERVKSAVEIQLSIEHSQPLPPGKIRWDDIVTQQRITAEKWASETAEIQEIVKLKQVEDHERAMKAWQDVNDDIQSLEKQQLASENIAPWLETVLRILQERTGKCATIIVGGPELKSQGNMVVTCMHQGVTPGSHPIDFNTFAGPLFQDVVIPKYIDFLKAVHPRKEREEKYGLPPIPNALTDMTHGASDNDTNVDDEVICANNRDEHIDQDLHSDGMQGSMLSILPGVDALPTPDHVCAPDSNPAVEHGVSPANNDTNGGNDDATLQPKKLRNLMKRKKLKALNSQTDGEDNDENGSKSKRRRHSKRQLRRSPTPFVSHSPSPSIVNQSISTVGRSSSPSTVDHSISAVGRSSSPSTVSHSVSAVDRSSLPSLGPPLSAVVPSSSPDQRVIPPSSTILSSSVFVPMHVEHCMTGIPKWLMEHLDVLQKLKTGGEIWQQALGKLIELERLLGFIRDTNRKLPTKNRPPAVGAWFKNARSPRFRPPHCLPKPYSTLWWKWWTVCQPEWRKSLHDEPAPLTVADSCNDWSSLLIGGNNGVICILFSLYWWGCTLEQDNQEEYMCWERAVNDVNITFGACLAK